MALVLLHTTNGRVVAVNPRYVTSVTPHRSGAEASCRVHYDEGMTGAALDVRGDLASVVRCLSDQPKETNP